MPSHHRRMALLGALLPAALAAQDPARVRAWQGTLTLPTYAEGQPDPNAPFDLLSPPGRPNYPYTRRDALTDRRAPRAWRALYLENEYLRCSVLPDMGGHLYACTDKVNGQELFYANTALKVSNIAYRGAWAAFGIEFNFPVSHNWMTASPVDFALQDEPGGGASIVVGNVDRPYGMQWSVRLTLRPGRALLEQRTTLYNRSDARRRFYWWTNAGVRAFDDTRILYPMRYTASHGFTEVDTWPVDARGTDNSVLRHHVYGPVSRFAHASREGFMGVYHPHTDAGVAHFAPPEELPAKKIWSWGVDADAMDWRRQLSDDSSAYVEIQAGLFRDQETYGVLQPQEQVSFTESWMPLRALGGLSRMNPEGAVHLERTPIPGDSVELRARVQLTRTLEDGGVSLVAGGDTVARTAPVTPAEVLDLRLRVAAGAPPATVRVASHARGELLRHVEGRYDFLPDSLVRTGRQPAPPAVADADRTDGDWLTLGERRELDGDMLGARDAYRRALGVNPRHREALRAAARLATTLGHAREGDALASRALALQPADHELAYYRALARLALGDSARARLDLEQAGQYGPVREAARLAQLRLLPADPEGRAAALRRFLAATDASPSPRVVEARVVAARQVGDSARLAGAVAALHAWPEANVARVASAPDAWTGSALAAHLAGDAERVLDVAEWLLDLDPRRAESLLGTRWPTDSGVVAEAGVPHPNRHPLVWYYRAWARARRGANADAVLDSAAARPLDYVFPNRARTREVLAWVEAVRPGDLSARYLLGMLAFQRGDVDEAVRRWRSLEGRLPVAGLHRNLGYALLLQGDTARADSVFAAGVRAEPGNPGVWVGRDSLLLLRGRPAAERAAALDAYPDRAGMPTALVYRYARLLAAAGRFDDAEALFAGRFLSRVEGGTNPRGVWLEVRVARAEALRAAGRCAAARDVLASLPRPVRGLAFTRDGLPEQLRRAPLAGQVEAVRRGCGTR